MGELKVSITRNDVYLTVNHREYISANRVVTNKHAMLFLCICQC